MIVKLANNKKFDIWRGLHVVLIEESGCQKDEYYKIDCPKIPANTELKIVDFDIFQWYDDIWMDNESIIFVRYNDRLYGIPSTKFELIKEDYKPNNILVI
jgi:hypothetical protein